ncbi:MAG: GGDEF domain-containing protein [Rhodospirillaceae bacterium]
MDRRAPPIGSAIDPLIEDASEDIFLTFQPIVSAVSGQCYGYQAMAHCHDRLEFPDLGSLYEEARQRGVLFQLDLMLRELAVREFVRFARKGERLFLNVDRRVLQSPDHTPGDTSELLGRFGLNPTVLCLELPEPLLQPGSGVLRTVLDTYRRRSYPLVLDKFGSGGAALMALHEQQFAMVRLDRALTGGIVADERKRMFGAALVGLARVMGITVIADGVSTENEFLACKQIGCDLVQGDFIRTPATGAEVFTGFYSVVGEANRRERRERSSDRRLLHDEMTLMPTLNVGDPMARIFQVFRSEKSHAFLPVLDDRRRPIGIIREIDLRDVIYSRFGKELLHNKALHRGPIDFLHPCPVCDISTEAEKILEVFSRAANPPGIILVDDFEYVGVLTAASLLRVINEKNLVQARDQNPLTRLPGNSSINDHIAAAFDDTAASWSFVYFDLDNFKPFNDRFGFRQGDRAILLFSELMRRSFSGSGVFIGHIGGDDFFASFRDVSAEQTGARVVALLESFRHDAESLYDAESREHGYIVARGRDGSTQQFPLLSCSAAVLVLSAGQRSATIDDLSGTIADLKKAAKSSPDHLTLQQLD